jgi:glycosyltransferase involved in cell wall biosynthesis
MLAVSVIIPNYNHGLYLKLRIDSVLNQSFKDFEVIILDDYSTDNSRVVIEEYRNHPKVRHILYNNVNSGSTFKQWKRGIELARSEWIWIAESDDWCEPVFLETLMNGINAQTAIAISQSLVVSNTGKVLWNSKGNYLAAASNGLEYIYERMLRENSIFNASMCIFRKSYFFNVGPEFTTYKFCGDWLFWINILMQGEIFVSGKILNYFRKHVQDVSNKAYRSGLYYIEYFKLIDHLRSRDIIDEGRSRDLMFEKFIFLLKDREIDSTVKKHIVKEFQRRIGNFVFKAKIQFALFRLKQRAKAFLLPDVT